MTEAICVRDDDDCKYVWLGLLREENANTLWQHKISAMHTTEALMVAHYGGDDMDVCFGLGCDEEVE